MEEKRHCPDTFNFKGTGGSKITFKDYMLKYEFIGRNAQIEYGPVSSQRKINGKIVFETKNTISLANDLKTYVIPKKSINRLGLIFKDEICLMNGSMIIGRPEDRLLK